MVYPHATSFNLLSLLDEDVEREKRLKTEIKKLKIKNKDLILKKSLLKRQVADHKRD